MEKVEPGKYVAMGYDLYEIMPDGKEELRHQTDREDPETVIYGVTQGMIRPLEQALHGLEKCSKFDVTAKADEAFGPYDPEQVVELPKDVFLVDGKFDDDIIKPGAYVPMMTADGWRINGLVKTVGKDKVTLDFNHPLAGKDVRFKGEVLEVRDATPEELHPAQGCGCGCHDCGDGCDCDEHDHCGDEGCGCGCSH